MIVGIDPGFTGAIAFLDKGVLTIHDLPLHKIMGRNQIDAKHFAHILKINRKNIKLAVIEDVHAMPKQGVVSTFRFGYNAGILLGALVALDIKVLRVKPVVWKSALDLNSDKNKSRKLISNLYPEQSYYFKRAKDDGRAEAALLAHFATLSF